MGWAPYAESMVTVTSAVVSSTFFGYLQMTKYFAATVRVIVFVIVRMPIVRVRVTAVGMEMVPGEGTERACMKGRDGEGKATRGDGMGRIERQMWRIGITAVIDARC